MRDLPARAVRRLRRGPRAGRRPARRRLRAASSAPPTSGPTRSRSAPGAHRRRHRARTGRRATRAQGLIARDSFSTGEVVAGLANAGVRRRRRPARRRRRHHRSASCSRSCSWSRCSSARCRSAPRCSTRRRTPSPAGAGCSASSTPRPTSPTRARPAQVLPRGPIDVALRATSRSPTPAGRPVLHDVDLAIAPRHPGRGRRRDRVGQDHVRQAAHPADGPDRRAGPARRRRPARACRSPRCGAGS